MWELRTMRGMAVALAAAGAAAVSGCSDSTEPLEPCTGPVELTSTGGTQPRFDWTPRCGAGQLLLPLPPSHGVVGLYWGLSSEERLIAPGVRYAVVPAGTTELSPPMELPSGGYQVVLRAPDGSVIAEEGFVP